MMFGSMVGFFRDGRSNGAAFDFQKSKMAAHGHHHHRIMHEAAHK